MSTRDSVLGEYYGVASDCVERNGAIAAMADEIVRLRKIETAARVTVSRVNFGWDDIPAPYALDALRATLTPEAPTDG